jgi:hypothetical protein
MQLWILLQVLLSASAFSLVPSRLQPQPSARIGCGGAFRYKAAGRSLYGTRDDEIAELEAQLRQLRESEKDTTNASTSEGDDDKLTVQEFEVAKRRLEKMKGKDMLLTEQYLISGGLVDKESQGSNLLGIVGAVVAIVFVLLFSQVPIGQEDLARYSATGSSNLKSIDLGDLNPDAKRI